MIQNRSAVESLASKLLDNFSSNSRTPQPPTEKHIYDTTVKPEQLNKNEHQDFTLLHQNDSHGFTHFPVIPDLSSMTLLDILRSSSLLPNPNQTQIPVIPSIRIKQEVINTSCGESNENSSISGSSDEELEIPVPFFRPWC